jgi:hypothetical protein
VKQLINKIPRVKKLKNRNRMKEEYINDIDIIIEAISNGDSKDAIKMLKELQEDLKIILLIS